MLTPGAIAPDVRGRDVRLEAMLDGAFATPKPEPFVVSGTVAGRSAFPVQSALHGLSLGG